MYKPMEAMSGMMPSVLEKLSVEIACRMTKRYENHVALLSLFAHNGVARFAECGAIRILVCLLNAANMHVNTKEDVIETLLDYVRTADIKQKQFTLHKITFLKVEFDSPIAAYQQLDTDPTVSSQKILYENTLYQTPGEDTQSIMKSAAGKTSSTLNSTPVSVGTKDSLADVLNENQNLQKELSQSRANIGEQGRRIAELEKKASVSVMAAIRSKLYAATNSFTSSSTRHAKTDSIPLQDYN